MRSLASNRHTEILDNIDGNRIKLMSKDEEDFFDILEDVTTLVPPIELSEFLKEAQWSRNELFSFFFVQSKSTAFTYS